MTGDDTSAPDDRAARFGYGEDWDGTGLLINGVPFKEWVAKSGKTKDDSAADPS